MKTYYNRQGIELKCRICGIPFKHLGSHIYHRHKITAREYKTEYGLPYNMSLISSEIYEKKKEAFEMDREKYLNNLDSIKYRFKKGRTGQRRISEHERITNIKRIENVNKKRKGKSTPCPVCKMLFNNIESHLYTKHSLLLIDKGRIKG